MITVVLDDDPTGTQAMSDVPVVLDWLDAQAWTSVRAGDTAVHVLTNSRAHDGGEARDLVASAATAARRHHPSARVVLRGDSTLRGHLWEEYEALRAVAAPGREDVPLLLVPALPAAGRVTVGGTQLLERDGKRIPLDETEYATDAGLAYGSAHLPLWAEERSGGRFAARDAVCVPLGRLRASGGAAAVVEAIAVVSRAGRPGVVVPDAETDEDLRTIATGVYLAEDAGIGFLVRSAPAFVAVLTGRTPSAPAAMPEGGRGVLVVCGSFVSTSTAQIEQLVSCWPRSLVPARVGALAGADADDEVGRVAALARARLEAEGLAVVSTERVRDPAFADPEGQRRIASALARVTRLVDAGVVIAKGGVTSAVTLREGLRARAARVIGPVRTGISRWQVDDGRECLVVPGNVGGADLLVELVRSIAPGASAASGLQC